jgi:hypothetical protein
MFGYAAALILTGCGGSGASDNVLGQTEIMPSDASSPGADAVCGTGQNCAVSGDDTGETSSPVTTVAWTPITVQLTVWPEGTYVARTESEWNAIWDQRTSFVTPSPVKPIIDFTSSMVVGISLGMWPNGCHRLEILQVLDKVDELEVHYRHVQPSGEVMCTTSFVPVVGFVTVPSSTKSVRFVSVNG